MKKIYLYEILTLIGILIFGILLCVNTYDLKVLQEDNENLTYRIKLLETKNALYENINEYEVEDVNKDGAVDISDIAIVKNKILKGKQEENK